MGVYIKDMEMPKSCIYCPMRKWHIIHGEKITYCMVAVKPIDDENEKPNWCPLIEVPEDVHPLLEYGGWTAEGNDEYGNYWDECTACRKAVWFPPFVKNDYKYCPHCGARMDGAE